MIRQVALLSFGAVAWMFLAAEVRGQFTERRVNFTKTLPERPPGAKRPIPKLVIDPGDRMILLKALTDGVHDAESLPDPQQRVSALANMACGLVLTGDSSAANAALKKANASVEELPGELTKAFSLVSMATQLGEYGAKDEARAAVASAMAFMKSLDPVNRIHVARGLATAQAMIGEDVGTKPVLEDALDGLTKMTNEGQWQRSLTLTVDGFLEAGDFERVLDIAEAIPEMRSDLKESVLANVVRKLPRVAPEDARSVLERAIRIAKGIGNVTLKAQTLSSIAVEQAQIGDLAGAAAIAGDLAKKSQDPAIGNLTVPVYVAIASAQFTAGDKAKSNASFAESVRLAHAIGKDNLNLRGMRLRLIAATQAKYGEFAEALKTTELIENDNYNKSLAFSEIGVARVVAKDNGGAIADFRRAFELGKAIEGQPNLNINPRNAQVAQRHALFEAACGLAAAKDFRGAIEATKQAKEFAPKQQSYQVGNALSQIAGEQVWAGEIDGALKTADGIEDEWSRLNAYEHIAMLEGEAGAETHAYSWIAKQDDPQHRLRLLWAVVRGLAKRSTNPSKDLPDLSKLKKQGATK